MVEPWDIDDRARELLENVCGFPVGAMPSGLAMLPESQDLECIAGDGCGGCFYLWHSQGRGDRVPVVYLSSYGEASRFADNFADALTIVAAFPGYWGDMLVGACKGGDRIGPYIAHYEAQLEPGYAEARAELCDLLALDPASAGDKLVAAVGAEPPFAPLLDSDEEPTPAGSFAARPYPR